LNIVFSSNTYCVDIPGYSTTINNYIQGYPCNYSSNEQWEFVNINTELFYLLQLVSDTSLCMLTGPDAYPINQESCTADVNHLVYVTPSLNAKTYFIINRGTGFVAYIPPGSATNAESYMFISYYNQNAAL